MPQRYRLYSGKRKLLPQLYRTQCYMLITMCDAYANNFLNTTALGLHIRPAICWINKKSSKTKHKNTKHTTCVYICRFWAMRKFVNTHEMAKVIGHYTYSNYTSYYTCTRIILHVYIHHACM